MAHPPGVEQRFAQSIPRADDEVVHELDAQIARSLVESLQRVPVMAGQLHIETRFTSHHGNCICIRV